MSTKSDVSGAQALFRKSLVGILIYAVVLGFFNDYTDIFHSRSYSVTFAVAVVLQILTYLTFALKDRVVAYFQRRGGSHKRAWIIFSVWLIMFLSKFVFLAVISFVFQEVVISGFIGLFVIIICTTVAQKLVEMVDERLGGKLLSR